MTKLRELAEIGQSVWLDYIRRSFITSGELQEFVDDGGRGVTSNPSIFEKAIAGSTDYDDDLHRLVDEGKSVEAIYEALVIDDIQRAADVLRPVYEATDGADGYVSLEVSPTLAHDTDGTIAEARRLHAALDRPNVMIKVPATPAGLPAIETLIGEGINVNVTLLFSIENYEQVANAYLDGLETLAAQGGDLSSVASVASFFVSRVTRAVDRELERIGNTELLGKIAIANAKVAYERFGTIFSGDRWEALAAQGARAQRVLWASTSTKNPAYADTRYVDSLIGPDTVNTVPPATLEAFRDHGTVARTVDEGLDEAHAQLERLATLGIDLDQITADLQDAGVESFADAFASLMQSIAEKRERLLAGWAHYEINAGEYEHAIETGLDELAEHDVLPRIWNHDYTVWSNSPEEITNRLGWLRIAEKMAEYIDLIDDFVAEVRDDGYTNVLLLGMGGSSLAPKVFFKTFGGKDGYADLAVLDSTDPAAVRGYEETLDLERTLFIVASKSGTTAETRSFFKYFYNRVMETVGEKDAGRHFVAITDPDTPLVDLAEQYHFRKTFRNDPTIGGRYSALSFFGLVPAALVGVDVSHLLDRAQAAGSGCASCVEVRENPAARLGVTLGELAKAGRDKATFIASPPIDSFGDWVEQLIAESTGKSGTGIVPVVGEAVGSPDVYGDDRLFIYLRLKDDESSGYRLTDGGAAPHHTITTDDETYDEAVKMLEAAGHPVVRIHLHDTYDLGGQMFTWELATAIAGQRLGIHPFNQPNVEAAKVLARKMIDEYTERGALPEQSPAFTENGLAVYGEVTADSVADALVEFLGQANADDYIALQAYVPPTQANERMLQKLRTTLRDETTSSRTTTLGFGPRFLHSTGQLHKGDAGNGLFIQFTSDPVRSGDVSIPDEAGSTPTGESPITFGVLKAAQAMGDRQALLDAGRRVLRIHLGIDAEAGLLRIVEELV